MVRIMNPPTLHVTLHNTGTVSTLSTQHTCSQTPTHSSVHIHRDWKTSHHKMESITESIYCR